MIKRIIIIFLLILLLLFLLLVGGSYLLLGTDTGFRWTTQKLPDVVSGLTIAPTSGNLESGIETESVEWQQDGMEVQAKGVTSRWDSGCLFASRYCLQKLEVEELRIKTRAPQDTTPAPQKTIELPQIKLPVDIEADEVDIKRLVLDLSEGSEPLVLEDLQLSAKTNGSTLTIENFTARYLNFSLNLSSEIVLEGDYPLDAQLTVAADNLVEEHDFQVNLTISDSLRKLDMVGSVTGAAELKLRGLAEPLEPGIPLNLNVNWDKVGWPLDTHQTVSSTDGLLYLSGNLDDYEMAFRSDIVGEQIPQSNVELKGQVNPSRALLHTVNVFTLDGFFTGSAAATWTNNVTWLAEMIVKDINPGKKWTDMDGQLSGLFKANGFVQDGKWTLDLTRANVDGTLRRFPLVLDTRLNKSLDDVWTIDHLDLDNGPNKLALSGTVSESLNIETEMDFPAVHYLIPTVAGNLKGKATITGKLEKPDIVVEASSSLLRTPAALFRKLKLKGSVSEAFENTSDIDLEVGILNINANELKQLRVELDGQKTDHTLKASVVGPQQTSVALKAEGALEEDFDWNGKMLSKTVVIPGHKWQLGKPVDLSWNQASQEFAIDAHCWRNREANLCLKNNIVAAPKGAATLSLTNYTLDTLNSQIPETARLDGTLSVTADVKWGDAKKPYLVNVKAAIDNGAVSVMDEAKQGHRFVYKRLNLVSQIDPSTINADLEIQSRSMGNGNVSLMLNPNNEKKSVVGDISLQNFNLQFLEAFLPDVDAVDGNVSVNGKLSGSLSDPIFKGRIDLAKPIFKSADLPLSIDGGNVALNIDGREAAISGSIKAAEGEVGLGGTVSWVNKDVKADIRLEGDSLSIAQKPIVSSTVHPKIRIRYSAKGLIVTGDVEVPSADINIKELPEGTTSLSDDVVIIEDEIEKKQEPQPGGSTLPVSVNVGIELGDQVNLTGYGLQAALSGDFSVGKKNADPPQLIGEIRVVEGLYKSYGQDLTIEDGQILFVGPIDQTTLNIDAVRSIDKEDRVAGLHLDGPIKDPKVTLFTEPGDKSQESILSYIVLGRDLGGDSTSSEQNLLATAALALTIRQGRGFATGFAESLGISDFTLEADGSGDDTQVLVSGRLSDKLLLRYGRSVFVPQDTLFLRYDISKRMYLEAAQGLERAVDVFYSFSF